MKGLRSGISPMHFKERSLINLFNGNCCILTLNRLLSAIASPYWFQAGKKVNSIEYQINSGERNKQNRPMGHKLVLLDSRKRSCTMKILRKFQRLTSDPECWGTPKEHMSRSKNWVSAGLAVHHVTSGRAPCVPSTSVSPVCFLSLWRLAVQRPRGRSIV